MRTMGARCRKTRVSCRRGAPTTNDHWLTPYRGYKDPNTRSRRRFRSKRLLVGRRGSAEDFAPIRQRQCAAVHFRQSVPGGGRVGERDLVSSLQVVLPPTTPVELIR